MILECVALNSQYHAVSAEALQDSVQRITVRIGDGVCSKEDEDVICLRRSVPFP